MRYLVLILAIVFFIISPKEILRICTGNASDFNPELVENFLEDNSEKEDSEENEWYFLKDHFPQHLVSHSENKTNFFVNKAMVPVALKILLPPPKA